MRLPLTIALLMLFTQSAFAQMETPKAADPRLTVELFAKSPDIVHPVACDFDAKGRLLVVESHTHFAPAGYKGPKFDRIRAFDPRLAPGAGKRATTFFEGTRHTMDIAAHADGSIYIATRNEILRLRDTKGTGVADEKTRIVFLDTKGDYPHNGLSGLCFDFKGDLTFGMGENLGAKYTLIGSDGTKFTGQGDGGHIFHCTADGKKLRRVATGFWNPFGICRDIFGRVFAVDNDPDQAPPCRMLHVVEGGDYGFRFCYGRSGKHPFQSWHGELPGTLPMMTGVGEAPCEILSYESDGLPKEYLGQLMVTSWADHRVERYKVSPRGASFKGERLPFVQGGSNFRPTGMCVAPDGSIYVCDWVLSNYNLHGKGAIWHIRAKDNTSRERKRPGNPKEAIFSLHRPLREAAARKLASDKNGRQLLLTHLKHGDSRVRGTALQSLIDVKLKALQPRSIARYEKETGIREMAVREAVERGANVIEFIDARVIDLLQSKLPWTIRLQAIKGINIQNEPKLILSLLADPDPFVFNATVHHIGFRDVLNVWRALDWNNSQPRQRLGVRMAFQRSLPKASFRDGLIYHIGDRDADETNRFFAVKWIADEKLADRRQDVENLMTNPKLSVRMYIACATALARLDGKDVNERSLADYFAKRLADEKTPPAQRAMLLKQVPATHPKLTVDLLTRLLKTSDAALKMEVVRALVEHPNLNREYPLLEIFRNEKESPSLRRYAMLPLEADRYGEVFNEVGKNRQSPLQADAKLAMINAVLGKFKFARKPDKSRPPARDLDAWLKRLEGKADPDAGARVFFHPKLAACSKCHRIDGRGADVGPDLSGIGRTDRRHILESILQPSNTVAPHYVAWHLETAAGKVRTGMLIHTNLDEYTYLDAKGERFKLRTGDLTEQRPLTTSIMPDGLIDRMTDQELRDLLAYLQSRK
ncbi:MAG: c-type cytochrome [Planctomycetes bacterium]|nr:c-type cytochrome [Planctomycetota bacterium]